MQRLELFATWLYNHLVLNIYAYVNIDALYGIQ